MNKSTLERFESRYTRETSSGCWLWTAGKHQQGYGLFRLDKKQQRANRVAWELYRGKIPEGMHVLHKCDVPSCVNPDHLFLGTHRDNVHDSVSKNRHRGAAKLTEEQVREIRNSSEKIVVLAKRFHVAIGTIGMIRTRRNWKHLK